MAAHRNHHSARHVSLSNASLRAPGAELGERRRLDEVEEVEKPDPGDAGEDVQPPRHHVEPASGIGEVVEDDSELHVESSLYDRPRRGETYLRRATRTGEPSDRRVDNR